MGAPPGRALRPPHPRLRRDKEAARTKREQVREQIPDVVSLRISKCRFHFLHLQEILDKRVRDCHAALCVLL